MKVESKFNHEFGNAIAKLVTILYRPQCVNPKFLVTNDKISSMQGMHYYIFINTDITYYRLCTLEVFVRDNRFDPVESGTV